MRFFVALCILSIALTAANVFAAEEPAGGKPEYRNILSGSTTGAYTTYLKGASRAGSNLLSIGVDYSRDIAHGFGISFAGAWVSSSASDRALELAVGPEFNFFGEDVSNSPYLQVLGGISHESVSFVNASASETETGTAISSTHGVFAAVAGKRFELFSHVSYSPEVAFVRVFNESSRLSFVPIKFSFLF